MARIFLLRRMILVSVALIGAIALQACVPNPFFKVYPKYRYRLTAVVDTPEGRRTGSSVIEVSTSIAAKWLGTLGGMGSKARGEAVMVDLGRRGTMFVLLKGVYMDLDWAASGLSRFAPSDPPKENYRISKQHADAWFNPVFDKHMKRVLALRGPYVVRRWYPPLPYTNGGPIDGYPLMVRFRDPAVPASVERVDPYHLDTSFGKGVVLRGLIVERTEDRVTNRIVDSLPWLKTARDAALVKGSQPVSKDPFPFNQTLSFLDFRRQ